MTTKRRALLLLLLVVIGVLFISWGVARGEDQTVFRKASNVCMECIGLG